MIRWICMLIIMFGLACFSDALSNEKIIEVPSEMLIEFVVVNEFGLLNGVYDIRVRLFRSDTYERLWYEDYEFYSIEDGAFSLSVNTDDLIIAEELHYKNLLLVLSINNESVEIPLLTGFYSYRSIHAEYGYDTRYPDVFYVDRSNGFIGIGTQSPMSYLDVNGSMKIGQ